MNYPIYTKHKEANLLEINMILSDTHFVSIRLDEDVAAIGVVKSLSKCNFIKQAKTCTEQEFIAAQKKFEERTFDSILKVNSL